MPEGVDTRRALLGGAVAGSLLLLAGPRAARAQLDQEDRDILRGLLDRESRALALYERAAGDGALGGEAGETMRRFAEHQQEHVDALASALGGRQGATSANPPTGRQAVLEAAVTAEDELVAAYFDAHARLADTALITLGAGVMANHGQHLVALRDLLGEDVLVPEPFATGGAPAAG